jgi:site-specific DNA-methyltransferase (adenine-specific)
MRNEVIHGDCMDVMRGYPDGYFELACVDPDFGLGDKISSGGTWAAKYKKGDGNLGGKPPKEYFTELFRVSRNQIIWGGNYFIDDLYSSRCFLIWDKVAHMDTLADCEMAWTSFDANAKIFKHVRNASEARIHICQKPVKLYDWIFHNYAKEGDKILDTHLGSGSSRIAAHRAGLDFVGCELDPDYWAAQEKRYKDFTSQLTLF